MLWVHLQNIWISELLQFENGTFWINISLNEVELKYESDSAFGAYLLFKKI